MKPTNLNIKTFVVFAVCMFLAYIQAHSQVMLELRYASTQMMHVKDLRNFSINNSSGSQFQCIIQIEVTKDDKLVSVGESSPVVLPAGKIDMLTWNGANVNQRPTSSNIGALRPDGTFSGGAYMACIKILDINDRAELAMNCEVFSVAESGKPKIPAIADTSAKNNGRKKFPISFHGNAEVSGYFANRAPMYSDYSPNYGHVFLNPTLSIYDVPLTGTLLISTQNSPLRQNMNVYNFSFDAETFKANLIARLQKALVENKKLNELTGGRMATLGKIQNLENLMQNPEVQKELQGLKDLEASRKQLEEIEGINKILGESGGLPDNISDIQNMDYNSALENGQGQMGNIPNMDNVNLDNITNVQNLDYNSVIAKGQDQLGNITDVQNLDYKSIIKGENPLNDIGNLDINGLPNLPNDSLGKFPSIKKIDLGNIPKIPKNSLNKIATLKDINLKKDKHQNDSLNIVALDSLQHKTITDSLSMLAGDSSATKNIKDSLKKHINIKDLNLKNHTDSLGKLPNINNLQLDNITKVPNNPLGKISDIKGPTLPKNPVGKLPDFKKNTINGLLKNTKDSLENADTSSVDYKKLKHRYDSLGAKADSMKIIYDTYKGKYDSLKTVSDSLTGLVDKLKHLDYKKGGYDALLNQKEGLMNEAKKNGWMDSLGRVKDIADDLSKVDMSKINDPEYLTGQLSSRGLLKKYEKYLSWIKKFSLGTSFTQFSEYSLNNVPVSGISVELAPWKLYAAFTYGQVQRSVLTQDVGAASYKRNMIAASIGYGTQEKTHFHINVLSSQDDPNSINPRDSIYLYYKKPQSNKVIGADFGINFWKDRIRVTGELSGSQLVRDLTYQNDENIIELQDTVFRSEKDWIQNIFRQKPVNLNTVTDFAFFTKAEALLFKDKTKITFGASRVGANYQSFGTPFLMRDLLTFEGKVSQKFLKNKISASVYIRQMSNNLSGDKPITVNQWRWGGDLSLNFPKMPVVRITYTPILQQNDSGTVNMNMMSANVSYPAKIKKVRLMSMASYIFQNGTKGTFAQPFTSHFITFNENIMFPKGQTFGATVSYIYTKTTIETLHSLTGSISASMTLFKKWNNGAGVNVYANKMEQRYMLFYRTGISFLKYLTLNIQVEGQIYRNGRQDALYPTYDVVAIRPLLNVRW